MRYIKLEKATKASLKNGCQLICNKTKLSTDGGTLVLLLITLWLDALTGLHEWITQMSRNCPAYHYNGQLSAFPATVWWRWLHNKFPLSVCWKGITSLIAHCTLFCFILCYFFFREQASEATFTETNTHTRDCPLGLTCTRGVNALRSHEISRQIQLLNVRCRQQTSMFLLSTLVNMHRMGEHVHLLQNFTIYFIRI